MSYVVLARKWRPMRFEDLVGQDHVARTLGNAIDAGRVAHAFLFTGVRGVGKTTSARILAKALNCMRAPGSLQEGAPDPGPTVTPCLQCSACREITDGRDVDVQEIDGASNNGVEEVRRLQESLPYRPQRDRFKIVIVDEVHMLSNSAWNAFLKTLEEPPPHVKFIFATTEVHKVPITVLSRVQRFDFKLIPTRLIVERLRWVLEQEGSQADDVALSILARQAAGSMRDAMSLLDQVLAFSGQELSGDDVARVLGVASRRALLDLARSLVEGQAEQCLRIVGQMADQGFDIPHVTRDLLALLRDLVVAKVCKDPGALLDSADEERVEVGQIAGLASDNDLMRLHTAFSRGYDDVVRSVDPRAGLEMLLVRLAHRPALLPVDELLHRLGHLEKRLQARTPAGGGGVSSGGAPGASARNPLERAVPRAPRRPARSGSGADDSDESSSEESSSDDHRHRALSVPRPALAATPLQAAVASTSPPPSVATSAAPARPAKVATEDAAPAATQDAKSASGAHDWLDDISEDAVDEWVKNGDRAARQARELESLPAPAARAPEHQKRGAAASTSPSPREGLKLPVAIVAPPTPAETSVASQPTTSPPMAAQPIAALPFEAPFSRAPEGARAERLARMMAVSEELQKTNIELSAYFEQAVPLESPPDVLRLGLEKGHVFEGQLLAPKAQEEMRTALQAVRGPQAQLVLDKASPEALPELTLAAERARLRAVRYHQAVEAVKQHPKVQEAVRIFGATIVRVQLAE